MIHFKTLVPWTQYRCRKPRPPKWVGPYTMAVGRLLLMPMRVRKTLVAGCWIWEHWASESQVAERLYWSMGIQHAERQRWAWKPRIPLVDTALATCSLLSMRYRKWESLSRSPLDQMPICLQASEAE